MITQEIIRQAQQGDGAAFTQIYNETIKTAYYVARRILVDETATEDVLQDAYIAVYEHLGDYKEGKFQGWVDTIVANRAKNYLRKKNPVLFSQMETEDNLVVDFEEEKIEFRPDASVDYSETKRLVMEMIDGLSPEQRLATILFYFEQRSVKEIAQICDCTENTIKSRLNYARKKIKDDVLALEKKGTKLYCTPIIPFLYWMLRQEAALTLVPATTKTVVAAATQSAVQQTATGAANVVETASTATQTVVQTATGAAVKTGMSLSTKIIIGVVSASLIVGGGAVAIPAIQNYMEETMEEDEDRDEEEQTEDDGMITVSTTTDNYSEEELQMFKNAIAGGMTYVHYFGDDSVWAAKDVPEQLKIFAFYEMMARIENESYMCSAIESFVEAGVMEEGSFENYGRTQMCAKMSLEQYMSAQACIWEGGISEVAAKQYLDDMASQGGYVFPDGSYGIYPTYEYSGCIVENIMVQEDSNGNVFFNASGRVEFDGEEIARYEVQFDLVKNEASPFAGLTITNIQYQLVGETEVEDEKEDEVVGNLFKTDFYLGEEATYIVTKEEYYFGNDYHNEYYQISGWDNVEKQEEWNALFKNSAETNSSTEDLGTSCEIKTQNAKYLSISICGTVAGGMHPYTYYGSTNIDMQTGKEILFEDVIDVRVCAQKIVNGEYVSSVSALDLEKDILDFNYFGDDSVPLVDKMESAITRANEDGILCWNVYEGKLIIGFYTSHANGDCLFLTIE